MAESVAAAVLSASGQIALQRFPRPVVGPRDMLLRVLRAGVCGTDVEVFKGLLTEFPLPLVLGHEIVGEVVEIGEEAAVARKLRIGERVVLDSRLSCGDCVDCRNGRKRLCGQAGSYGLRTRCDAAPHLWGGMAEFVFVPPGATVFGIPPDLDLDVAVLTVAVIANGVQWVSRAGACRIGDVVLVQGPGPQGLVCCAAAKQAGAAMVLVAGLEKDRERLELARRFGADHALAADRVDLREEVARVTGGAMPDLIVDVAGSPHTPQVNLDLARPGGRIVHAAQIGTNVHAPLLMDTLVRKEIVLRGVISREESTVPAAFTMAADGRFPFKSMITERCSLDRVPELFETLAFAERRPIKAVVYPSGGADA